MDTYFNNIDDDGFLTVKSRDEKDDEGMFKNINLPCDEAIEYIKTHKHSAICGCLPDGTIFEVFFNGSDFIFHAAGFYS